MPAKPTIGSPEELNPKKYLTLRRPERQEWKLNDKDKVLDKTLRLSDNDKLPKRKLHDNDNLSESECNYNDKVLERRLNVNERA